MAAVRKPPQHQRKDPSYIAKGRIGALVQQDVDELGKIVRYVRQHSNSRDVLLKAAKKTASQEQSMENTLMNLRTIEKSLDKALDQADFVGRSMEQTAQAMKQIHHII